MKTSENEVANTPHMPSVKIDALPAEEVLIRGSVAPGEQSDVLLRAATVQETPKEQLLRVISE